MKKLLVFTVSALFALSAFSQGDGSFRNVNITTSFKLGQKITLIRNDTTNLGAGVLLTANAASSLIYGRIGYQLPLLAHISGGVNGAGSYTKGTILVANGSGQLIQLLPGTNGFILTSDNSTASGLLWGSVGSTGVTVVGTFNSQTPVANGLFINGANIYAQAVTNNYPGMMTSAQKLRLDSTTVIHIVKRSGYDSLGKYNGIDSIFIKAIKVDVNNATVTPDITDSTWHITVTINNAAADGTTKGIASFNANDFDASSGNISLDYTNAQKVSSSVPGFLTVAQYKRLYYCTVTANPTGTITHDVDAAGQAAWSLTSAGGRTLAFSNLAGSGSSGNRDMVSIKINNTSGGTITLTLPSNSFVAGTGSAGSVVIPTGRSILTLTDYDGTNYQFALQSY